MPPDAAPLLAAIASDPEDDLPRLVYADWLDETGQPDRAEFVRLQCHSARVGPLDPSWAPAKLREYDLFRANEDRWRPGLSGNDVSYMLMARWRRGFPECVDLGDAGDGRFTAGEGSNGSFHLSLSTARRRSREHLDLWLGVRPIRELRFSDWEPGWDRVLHDEAMEDVRSMSLMEWYAGVRADDLEAFVNDLTEADPRLFPALRELDLSQGTLTLDSLEALANSPLLVQLTKLSLRFPENREGELDDWWDFTSALFENVAETLEHLDLQNLPPDLITTFVAEEWKQLRSLHIQEWGTNPFDDYARAVIPQLTTLRFSHTGRLDVRRTWLSEPRIAALARWPALRTVKSLSLGQVPARLMQTFLANLSGPAFEFFSASVEPDTDTPLRVGDLAAHPSFHGLKAWHSSLPAADLRPLADPAVLPELHTIWTSNRHPALGLRWRGGTRTVIPREPTLGRNFGQPNRDQWCGWYRDLVG